MFWRRGSAGGWDLAFKASLLLLVLPKSPTLPLSRGVTKIFLPLVQNTGIVFFIPKINIYRV